MLTTPFRQLEFEPAPRAPYPLCDAQIPPWLARRAPYRARFARTARELEAIQRLRYRVFNLELGEGLAESRRTGRDADGHDATSHHILVIDERSDLVVGTYRLATAELAARGAGFYSAQEFDLSALPPALLGAGVELGRACVAAAHRGSPVLALLFQGIAAYAAHNRKRFLFGCASLPADAAAGAAALTQSLLASGAIDANLAVKPRAGFEVPAPDAEASDAVELPPLVKRYLRLGARLGPEPALDRAFGTLDYFTLLDLQQGVASRALFARDGRPRA
jgi:putative hemolysin